MKAWKFSLGYLIISTIIILFLQLSGDVVNEDNKILFEFLRDYLPIVMSLGLCWYYWKEMEHDVKEKKLGDSIYPTLMAAQGTFFTFVGISIILFLFSHEDPAQLISGLKLAFFTSAIGMMASIVAKAYLKFETERYTDTTNVGESIAYYDENDFFRLLLKMHDSIDKQGNRLNTAVQNSLKKFDDDVEKKMNSLYTKLLEDTRTVNNQIMGNIGKDFKEINSIMVEMKTSMQEVNTEIKGIGSTCKETTKTLQKLKDKTKAFTDESFQGMDKISSGINKISNDVNSLDFTGYVTSITNLINPLLEQLVAYNNVLQATKNTIDDSGDEFTKAYKAYLATINEIKNVISSSISNYSEQMSDAMTAQKNAVNEVVKLYMAENAEYKNYMQAYRESMQTLVDINNAQGEYIANAQNAYKTNLETHMNMMNNSIGIYAGKLDEFADTFTRNASGVAEDIASANTSLRDLSQTLVMDVNYISNVANGMKNVTDQIQLSIDSVGNALMLGKSATDNMADDYGKFSEALMKLYMSSSATTKVMEQMHVLLEDLMDELSNVKSKDNLGSILVDKPNIDPVTGKPVGSSFVFDKNGNGKDVAGENK